MPTTRALFQRHGLRCTRQRLTVYEALRATRIHPTTDQLRALVAQRDPSISTATVYNTLDALCEAGLAKRIVPEHPAHAARYDADIEEHLHIETADGRIIDVPEAAGDALLEAIPEELIRKVEFLTGVSIDRVSMRLIEKSSD